jgi:methylase of polypeptide subunit release factors
VPKIFLQCRSTALQENFSSFAAFPSLLHNQKSVMRMEQPFRQSSGLNLSEKFRQIAQKAQDLTEATLRHEFVQSLREFVFQITGYDPFPQLEEQIALPSELGTVLRGRSDARLGCLVCEIKTPEHPLDEAIAQCRSYLDGYRQQGIFARGVAYNGVELALISETGAEIWRGRAEEGASLLEAWLLLLALKIVDPQHLVLLLGFPSALARNFIADLLYAFRKHEKLGFVEEAFRVWQAVYGAAANLTDEAVNALRQRAERFSPPISVRNQDEALQFVFVLETYLSVLLRLFVARLAVQQRLVEQSTLRDLLHPFGSQPTERLRHLATLVPLLSSVFEDDPFLWLCDVADADSTFADKFDTHLDNLARILDELDLVGVSYDFLRRFYQHFFDPPIRRALGEFYTDESIVNDVLEAAGFDGTIDGVLVDITCGSGTFLVVAIRKLIERERERERPMPDALLLQFITDRVVGVDLHPFAVAMARVNYLLALGDLLSHKTLQAIGRLHIPVYWADSLARLVVNQQNRLGEDLTETVKIPALGEFTLPHHHKVDWERLFDALKEALPQRGIADPEKVWNRLRQRLGEDIALQFETTLRQLAKQWSERHNQNRDSRWLPLLRNMLAVERLRGLCSLVIGNPPWVRIHNLEPSLRDRVYNNYAFCRTAGWQRGSELAGITTGFARQIDYAVAFIERGLELLKAGGVLALVVTSKIQQALYASALREHFVTRCQILRLVDFSLYEQPLFFEATNYPLVFAVRKERPDAKQKTMVTLVNRIGRLWTYELPQNELPLLADDPKSPWLMASTEAIAAFRKMQEGNLLLGDLVKPHMGVKTAANHIFVVRRVEPSDDPNEVVVEMESGELVRVERNLLRPLLRGENIQAWRFEVREWILWTHDDVTGEVLGDLPPRAKRYFESHANELCRRSDYRSRQPFWTIFRVSPDKLGDKVAWQRISNKMDAVYVPRIFEGQIVICLDSVYFVPTGTPEIGLATAAWLNSLPVRTYMMAYSERLRGSYFQHHAWVIACLPVPRPLLRLWEGKKRDLRLVRRMIEISERMHENPDRPDAAKLEDELAYIVAQLYELSDEDFEALKSYWEFIQTQRSP